MRNAHVLIVDDEPELVQALALRLRAAGCRVSSAGDGLTALEACLRDRPDLVLLDLVLPGEDGLDLLQRLRGLGGGTLPPVVCLTARTEPGLAGEALAAGACAFVTKPFDGRALLRLLQAHLPPAAADEASAAAAPPAEATVHCGARLSQP